MSKTAQRYYIVLNKLDRGGENPTPTKVAINPEGINLNGGEAMHDKMLVPQ